MTRHQTLHQKHIEHNIPGNEDVIDFNFDDTSPSNYDTSSVTETMNRNTMIVSSI